MSHCRSAPRQEPSRRLLVHAGLARGMCSRPRAASRCRRSSHVASERRAMVGLGARAAAMTSAPQVVKNSATSSRHRVRRRRRALVSRPNREPAPGLGPGSWHDPSTANPGGHCVALSGSVTTKLAPWPTPELDAVIDPPWSSIRCFAIARPSPRPACERV